MSVYIAIEVFSVIILLLVIIGLYTKHEKSKSSRALAWAAWANVICSGANALIYFEYGPGWPTTFLFLMTATTYIFGNVTMFLFTYYDYCYIREYTPINKWLYYFPMGICIANFFLSILSVANGDVFTSEQGVYTETEGLPIVIFLLYFLCIVYLPIAPWKKRKEIGIFRYSMLAVFSVSPLVSLIMYALEIFDYTYASGAISILAMYIFLDNELEWDKEIRLRKEMRAHQHDLEKAKQIAESANQAKTSFLFNMSHDIRTPMNAIMGYTQLLENNLDNKEKCNDYLGKINLSSRFLLGLINNVLEMSRIESGKATLDEEVHSFSEIVDLTESVCANQMREKNLKFSQVNEVKTSALYFDIVKVKEIYLNIISNSYKYTPEGGTISVKSVEQPSIKDGYITIQTTIEDTGIGMSKEFLPHLFDDFARERTSTEAKVEGTGLGMAIVKKLVDLMEGSIDVESEPGKGTRFVISLPMRVANDSSATFAKNANIDLDVLKGKRVLLAEDNELNAEIAIELLSASGLVVDRVCDGVECIDKLVKSDADTYDVILTDIQMPTMNGYETARRIRSLDDKKKADIPILAMTANAFEKDRKDAFAAGMNGHISKPIEIDVLLRELYQHIGQ